MKDRTGAEEEEEADAAVENGATRVVTLVAVGAQTSERAIGVHE